MAEARLDRCPDHHLRGARAQHHGARACVVKEIVMSSMANVGPAPTPHPTVTPRQSDAPGRSAEKVSVRDLSFFYGENRALKSINVALYDRKVTAFIGPS